MKLDIWEFCRRMRWQPSKLQIDYLRAAQDGKPRIGMVAPIGSGLGDVTAIIAMWRLLTVQDMQCFVVAPFLDEARYWFQNAERLVAEAEPATHQLFRFAQDKTGICLTCDTQNMGILAALPGELAMESADAFRGKPLTLVMGGFSFVPQDYVLAAGSLMASDPRNLWMLIMPESL